MAMPRNLQRRPAKPAFGNGRIQWQEILSPEAVKEEEYSEAPATARRIAASGI
jgi:hypothetical protein